MYHLELKEFDYLMMMMNEVEGLKPRFHRKAPKRRIGDGLTEHLSVCVKTQVKP